MNNEATPPLDALEAAEAEHAARVSGLADPWDTPGPNGFSANTMAQANDAGNTYGGVDRPAGKMPRIVFISDATINEILEFYPGNEYLPREHLRAIVNRMREAESPTVSLQTAINNLCDRLGSMNDTERYNVFRKITEGYCIHCGSVEPKPSGRYCQCQNDE